MGPLEIKKGYQAQYCWINHFFKDQTHTEDIQDV